MGFKAHRISWGFASIVPSMPLGATLIRSSATKLATLIDTPNRQAEVSRPQTRLARYNGLKLLILLSAVAVMIFKP